MLFEDGVHLVTGIRSLPIIDITYTTVEGPLLAGTTTTEVIISGGGFEPVTGEPEEIDDEGGEPSGAKGWGDLWDWD